MTEITNALVETLNAVRDIFGMLGLIAGLLFPVVLWSDGASLRKLAKQWKQLSLQRPPEAPRMVSKSQSVIIE